MARRRSRAASRGVTAVEAAVTFAVVGSLLAVAVPAFLRELHASRFVEPVDGLTRMGEGAVAYAKDRPVVSAFPASAPQTPAVVPRGTREVDPPGAWETPTWQALAFRPAPDGAPHAFAFGFDSALLPARSTFTGYAHGDLDGDGITSTFEVRGHATDADGPVVDPGMVVDAEVE